MEQSQVGGHHGTDDGTYLQTGSIYGHLQILIQTSIAGPLPMLAAQRREVMKDTLDQ